MAEFKIGNFQPKNRIFLAPMLEPNDIAFRLLCQKAGSGINFTGMVNPKSKEKLYLEDKPFLQLFSSTGENVKEFIKEYENKVSGFDFNLGCPSTLAEKMKFGSFMHENPDLVVKILKDMRESTNKPITLKIRKSRNTLEIIKASEKYIDAVSIHPRTREQGYSGEPDLEFARKVKETTKIPVIYSGNVNTKNYESLLKEFDFLMIGREAIGNPNIFSIMNKTEIDKITFKDYLELAKKYEIEFPQIKYHALAFTKGIHKASQLRYKIAKAKSTEEIETYMKEYNLLV